MKVKGWQLIVIALGLLIGVGSIVYLATSSSGAQISYLTHYIDVETGDVYRLDTRKHAIGVPGIHPKSGRICLVRLSKADSGGWTVSPRDRSTIAMLGKDVKNIAIDPATGDFLITPKPEIDYPLH